MLRLETVQVRIPGTDWGVRVVEGLEPNRLRLFFLSLLWRAAATDRQEFADVVLPKDDLRRLGQMLITSDPTPLSFYPVQLTQLSSRGEPHNLTPISRVKKLPRVENFPGKDIPIFRFYMDGLIAHFDRQSAAGDRTDGGDLEVGVGNRLLVTTVSYEGSFQYANLKKLREEALESWPEIMAKLSS